jgi:ribonuclease-3
VSGLAIVICTLTTSKPESPRARRRVRSLYFPRLATDEELREFEQRISYTFQHTDLLVRSLTHKSYSHEAKQGSVRHNETFEFLGDSVLGFVVGDILFRQFPTLDEGALSKMKAFLVSSTSLAEKARLFDMGKVIFLGVGEEKTGGRKKDSLLANVYEALIAGVYLDGGVDAARRLIELSFGDDLRGLKEDDLLFHDYKTALQELAQGKGLPLPDYHVVGEVGPDHDKTFIVDVKVGTLVARGEGSSKKEAQQQAAKHALGEYK